jgi:hypothetical protein
MQTCSKFIAKFASSIVTVLGCFDRLLFKGYLPFGGDEHLNRWVDGLGLKRKDFLARAEQMSQSLVEYAQQKAAQAGVEYRYLPGKVRKETLIDNILKEKPVQTGLIAVLCCQEVCRTIKLRYAKARPRLEFAYRPQRVLYYYLIDKDFGRVHIRIQTWFPFTVQVYVNGHDWLAQQLTRRKIGFVQRDNAFTQLDAPQAAQTLAHRFEKLNLQSFLDRCARQVNPLLSRSGSMVRYFTYRWVIDQAEYSSDVIFKSPGQLTELYPRLLDHAAVNFSAQDILTFLGRRLHGRFDGEVLTKAEKGRHPGARIKHRMKDNWLKMYDKFGQILRVETVINQPREFKVRRRRMRDGKRQTVWCPMNKGIINLHRYRAVAEAANHRYLNALSVVADPAPAYHQVGELVQPKKIGPRHYAGFNPVRRQDVQLFRAILSGDHAVKGFHNTEIRNRLYPEAVSTKDPREITRLRNAVGRQLKRLHVRGLIAKIPHTRRWQVTHAGHKLLGTCLQLYYHGLTTAA